MVKFEVKNKEAILYVEGVREDTYGEEEMHIAKSVLSALQKRDVIAFEFVTDGSVEI
ncbi:hypothetical protein GLV98_02295 [Halobacillus litoralis]|uniref:Uncharacterized protein n=1 Tax=Halobacillus litoralis TaxID=45668 RepID=A0A845E946_9BACI|nr:hypothetical protein [Halobacillus litoralis]MYL48291.1 hypothetical protein [Halobacillus litoralis]